MWNLLFVFGIFLGGWVAVAFLHDSQSIIINPQTVAELKLLGVKDFSGLMPMDLFGVEQILSFKGLIWMVLGGFLVGFGTRYTGGCTSGHSIMGLSNLQWPSLVATICFMLGGIFCTQFLLPILLK